jgi:hypothetical protein
MVIGLLKGLGRMFETEINVTHVSNPGDGHGHDEFLVKFKTRAS